MRCARKDSTTQKVYSIGDWLYLPRVDWVFHGVGARPSGARAVELAEGVSTADESHCFGVVHPHAAEHLTDGVHAVHGHGHPEHALGIHVDEADGAGAQGGLAISVHLGDGDVCTDEVGGADRENWFVRYSSLPSISLLQQCRAVAPLE